MKEFTKVCETMQDEKRAADCRRHAEKIIAAIEASGWDGDWYRRAYYDDGFPLGSKQNMECRIDSLGQSWAVIAGNNNPSRVATAMESAYQRLVDHGDNLIRLLTPPFDKTPHNPGYIKGYPPGIRENGGQYTHAALWLIWAFADLGQADRAHELFDMINPIHHANASDQLERYRVEPYVIAADVYSTPPHNGRGGWTWYTGSASWMYRLGLERLLGITRHADTLELHPSIPKDWKGYQINYRFGRSLYHIRIENQDGGSGKVQEMRMDGKVLPDLRIPLNEAGGMHEIVVTLK
jgi:cellobiose phosphorylase